MGILAGKVVGVLAHVERADADRAGGLEPLHQRGIARRRRMLAVDLAAGAGDDTLEVEQILDGEGHAGKRQVRARVCEVQAAFGLLARSVSSDVEREGESDGNVNHR